MKYVFARDTCAVRTPGSKYPTTVHKGSAWYANCPLVREHPDLFSPDPPEVHPRGWEAPVEQASASPGEKRSTRRDD